MMRAPVLVLCILREHRRVGAEGRAGTCDRCREQVWVSAYSDTQAKLTAIEVEATGVFDLCVECMLEADSLDGLNLIPLHAEDSRRLISSAVEAAR